MSAAPVQSYLTTRTLHKILLMESKDAIHSSEIAICHIPTFRELDQQAGRAS